VESGTYESGYPLAAAEAMYTAILEQARCPDLDCLLALNGTAIEAAKDRAFNTSGLPVLHWGPVIDGVATLASPQALVAAGQYNKAVPVLLGSARDEWALFSNVIPGAVVPQYPEAMTEAQFDQLLAYLGPTNLQTVKRLYNPSVYPYPKNLGGCSQRWWTAIRIGTDNGIPFKGYPQGAAFGHCSARRVARHLTQGGTPSVHMYLFARPLIGHWVGHASEIPFVCHMAPALVSPGNLHLSTAMGAYWTRFATFGDPSTPTGLGGDGASTQPKWPRFTADGNRSSLRLDATFLSANITVEHDLRGAACDFWDTLADEQSEAPAVVPFY